MLAGVVRRRAARGCILLAACFSRERRQSRALTASWRTTFTWCDAAGEAAIETAERARAVLVEPAVGAARAKRVPARQHLDALAVGESREAHGTLGGHVGCGPGAVLERRELANVETLGRLGVGDSVIVSEHLRVVGKQRGRCRRAEAGAVGDELEEGGS